MIEKKGWLKDAEARTNGFYVKGKKVKGARMTQAEADAWNGVKKAAPAPAPVVEEVVVEEVVVEATEEEAPAPKAIFGKKRKKK
jgi:hypothetical protein